MDLGFAIFGMPPDVVVVSAMLLLVLLAERRTAVAERARAGSPHAGC